MSLEKTKKIDKVEFVGKWRSLHVRYVTEVTDNNEVIASNYSRDSFYPNQTLSSELQPFAEGVWTAELVGDYEAYLDSLKPIKNTEKTEIS